MKIEEILNNIEPSIELSIQKRQEIEYFLDSIQKPKEGHPLFEVDVIKKEVRYSSYKDIDTVGFLSWKKEIKKLDLVKNKNCVYISALNVKNLMRKIGESYTFMDEGVHHKNTHKNRHIYLLSN